MHPHRDDIYNERRDERWVRCQLISNELDACSDRVGGFLSSRYKMTHKFIISGSDVIDLYSLVMDVHMQD